MPVLLILLVAAVVELVVLIAVGNAIGVLATIGLLILASLVGAALLRREGTRTLVAFNEALRTRRPPHRELIDGMLIAAAAVFIVVPGFVSDVLGLLLLLPPTRALVRRRMLRSAERGAAEHGAPGHFAPGTVIEGEVVDESSTPRPGPEVRGPELR
ncbi:MAG: FxsA family protein [Pseudonocardiales bacterium]